MKIIPLWIRRLPLHPPNAKQSPAVHCMPSERLQVPAGCERAWQVPKDRTDCCFAAQTGGKTKKPGVFFHCIRLHVSGFSFTFAVSLAPKPDGVEAWWRTFMKGVYYVNALFLTLLESGSFNFRQRQGNGRCPVLVYFRKCDSHPAWLPPCMDSISAWASALLVLTERAMPEPQRVGRATGAVPTLFLCPSGIVLLLTALWERGT